MTSETERREIEDLLPWHAAGALGRREAERLEAALARDPELARRFAEVREELAADVHLNETLGAPSARAMDKLFAAIDAEPARRPPLALDLVERWRGFAASLTPRTLAWAASAAALVMVIQFAVIGGVMIHGKPAAPTYSTASAPGAATTTGAFVLIRFAPAARMADATRLLAANHASIVAGPMAGGFYRVRVADKPLAKAPLTAIVQRLQKDRLVDFASATE